MLLPSSLFATQVRSMHLPVLSAALLTCLSISAVVTAVPLKLERLDLSSNAPTDLEGGDGASPTPEGSGGGKGKKIAAGAAGAAGASMVAKLLLLGEREEAPIGRIITSVGESMGSEARVAGGSLRAGSRVWSGADVAALGLGEDAVTKLSYLKAAESAIKQVPVGRGMSENALKIKWATQPEFRATALEELAESNPDSMATFARVGEANPLVAHTLNHVTETLDPLVRMPDAVKVVTEGEHLQLKFVTPSIDDAARSDLKTQYVSKVEKIVEEALDELPEGTQLTDAELRTAFRKALRKEPRWSYAFNAQDGKLTLKLKTGHGEVTGEPNLYQLAKKSFYLATIGTGMWNKEELVARAKRYFRHESQPGSPTRG